MNAIWNEADFKKNLQETAGHCYLFFGEEDYLKNAALKPLRELCSPDPSFALFNDLTLDALDYTPERLSDMLMQPPMMSEAKLILVRGLDFTSMKPNEVEELLAALGMLAEYDYNTVVVSVAAGLIDTGYLPKRPSPLLKKLAEVLIPVQFETPNEAKLQLWVGRHFSHFGVNVSPADCRFLITYAGKSMFVLANEIEKLAAYALSHGRNELSEADIRSVSVPAPTPDAFALSNAILAGRSKEALDALAVMKFERTDPTVILGEISRTVCELQSARLLLDEGKGVADIANALHIHEYKAGLVAKAAQNTDRARLSRVLAMCAAADLSIKRYNGDYAPIERLICLL